MSGYTDTPLVAMGFIVMIFRNITLATSTARTAKLAASDWHVRVSLSERAAARGGSFDAIANVLRAYPRRPRWLAIINLATRSRSISPVTLLALSGCTASPLVTD